MSKKKNIQLTPIEFPEYQSFIHYFICPDKAAALKFVKDKRPTKWDDLSGDGACFNEAGRDPIVWLMHKKPSTIAHEMIHAVFHIFQNIGHVKITNDDNDEHFAYMVGYAIDQVLK